MRAWAGPTTAVVAAIGVSIGLALTASDPRHDQPAPNPDPTKISSDAPRFTTLGELVAATDLVVVGHAVNTDRGRTFGDPGSTVMESRLITLEIDDVVRAGTGPTLDVTAGAAAVVEEPGWLQDGTPLIVDGVAPTEPGDAVLWFLDAVPSPALDAADASPAYVLVGPQGHYRIDGDRLVPAAGEDPLSERLAGLGPDGLAAAVAAVEQVVVTPAAP